MPNTHSTLTSLFSDIADAIRDKKGTSAEIVADDFPNEIASISTGITPSGSLPITENGTYDVTEYAEAVVNVSGGVLPSAYTQLEYISSSGTQYIDTGVIPTENNVAEVDFELTGYTNNSYMAMVSASTHMYLVHFAHTSGSNIRFAPSWSSYGAPDYTQPVALNTRYKAKCISFNNLNSRNGGCAITDKGAYSQRNTSIETYTPTNNFYIFARNSGSGSVTYQTKAKLYALKIWTDGTLRRDFIPAKRNTDNVIGLYDTVSNTFFTNSGSGVFTGAALS